MKPEPVAEQPPKYSSHPLLGSLLRNSAFLLVNDILTRATTFVLYALIARFLGAYQFGQLSLALTILFTFQTLAPAGLKLLTTREVAENPKNTDRYLVNGSLIALFFSLLSYLILWLVMLILDYSADTRQVIILVSLGLLPFSLATICEAVFQGWERMRFITQANLPRNLGILLIGFFLLSQGYGLSSIAWLLSLSYFFLTAIEWFFVFRYISRPHFVIDLEFIRETIATSITFLGFQGTVAVSNSLIFIMLSKFAGETEVGFFSAANQILTPVVLLIQSMVLSVFPAMCRRYETSVLSLKALSDNLIELLMAITLPVVIGLVYLSGEILLLLFGNQQFLSAKIILRLILPTLILLAFTSVLGRDLLSAHREKTLLKIVLASSLISAFCGFFLIARYQLLGAAFASILFGVVDFLLHYRYTTQVIADPIPWRRLWKSGAASMVLIAFLAATQLWRPLLAALAGSFLYLLVWFGLGIWFSGGVKQFKIEYLTLWSESQASTRDTHQKEWHEIPKTIM